MAKLNIDLTLTSTDLFPDESLNLNLLDQLDVLGPVTTKRVIIDSSASVLTTSNMVLLASGSTKSYVLLYNTSEATSGEIITIGDDTNDDAALEEINLELAPGEFAFFPWNASRDIVADASSGTPTLEVRAYQVAL
tara:strand:+ start:109 stop:516 length:408 start_codon:yes stop_codon:yes gene_type:complete